MGGRGWVGLVQYLRPLGVAGAMHGGGELGAGHRLRWSESCETVGVGRKEGVVVRGWWWWSAS